MNFKGLEYNVANLPPLDKDFVPFAKIHQAFNKEGDREIIIALYAKDRCSVHKAKIHSIISDVDFAYVERLVKFLLWMKGGNTIGIYGSEEVYSYLKSIYKKGGLREFDAEFMSNVYEGEFNVISLNEAPKANDEGKKLGGNLKGCRIGFDAGGSDRKVSAVIDGETVYSEEVVWFPKTNADINYHYNGILTAFKTAASHMPRVDAIGVSSAGIYVENRCMVASLFIKVPKADFERQAKNIYIDTAKEIGAPVEVCNDGDVAALAGAMGLEKNSVLGIAMGTSEAAGFIDSKGRIKGWLNELAFAPVDLNENSQADEWSKDVGVGAKYFSQDGVIKLAKYAGIELKEDLSPAEKLKIVQELMQQKDSRAIAVYKSIGVYLGHTTALYYDFYNMENMLLMGRTMSGEGGDIILAEAKKVLAQEYSHINVNLCLPDEKTRRVGQSVAAASLPSL